MAQNVLHTRMTQKIDTVANWLNSTIIPLAGEICVGTDSEGNVVETKIGDNKSTYASLPSQSKSIFVGTVEQWQEMDAKYPVGTVVILTNDNSGSDVSDDDLGDLFGDTFNPDNQDPPSQDINDLWNNTP